jgi:hypothetical protein
MTTHNHSLARHRSIDLVGKRNTRNTANGSLALHFLMRNGPNSQIFSEPLASQWQRKFKQLMCVWQALRSGTVTSTSGQSLSIRLYWIASVSLSPVQLVVPLTMIRTHVEHATSHVQSSQVQVNTPNGCNCVEEPFLLDGAVPKVSGAFLTNPITNRGFWVPTRWNAKRRRIILAIIEKYFCSSFNRLCGQVFGISICVDLSRLFGFVPEDRYHRGGSCV